MKPTHHVVKLERYEELVGRDMLDRIRRKAEPLKHSNVIHINSTYYGGGVSELLTSLSLLMNSVGLKTDWRIIKGNPDFFSTTKKMHNALQGGSINLSDLKKQIYEETNYENSLRMHFDHDFIVIHDPQPLPLITQYTKKSPWIWRCHVDLTDPNDELWEYLYPFLKSYDAGIVSLKEYRREMGTPQLVFHPAIDPFSVKNRKLSGAEMQERLDHYDIPTDRPIIAQVSRFDRWKDPEGVIRVYEKVSEEVDCTLVLLGNVATDDPEGQDLFASLCQYRDDRVIVMSREDSALVNALQTRADVILQKSLREGFGLTVTEAMWKGTAVVGGNVGGIRRQITDGANGFLVDSVDEAAERVIELLKDDDLRERLGKEARETVRNNFLMPSLLEKYLDLFNGIDVRFELEQELLDQTD